MVWFVHSVQRILLVGPLSGSACQIEFSRNPQNRGTPVRAWSVSPLLVSDGFLRSLSCLKMFKRYLVAFSV